MTQVVYCTASTPPPRQSWKRRTPKLHLLPRGPMAPQSRSPSSSKIEPSRSYLRLQTMW
jgi:hypothetical protein